MRKDGAFENMLYNSSEVSTDFVKQFRKLNYQKIVFNIHNI